MPDDIDARPVGSPPGARVITVNVSPAAGQAGKFAAAAQNIAGMWREDRQVGLLQVVFLDPGPGDGPDPHGELREQLVSCGLPRSAVRLTRDAPGPREDPNVARFFPVGVLITGTGHAEAAARMVQRRRIAVHHLDIPRSSRDAQLRAQVASEGAARGSEPVTFRYVTTGTPGTGREGPGREEASAGRLTRGTPGVPDGGAPDNPAVSRIEIRAATGGSSDPVALAEIQAEIARLDRSRAWKTGSVPGLKDSLAALGFSGRPVLEPGGAGGGAQPGTRGPGRSGGRRPQVPGLRGGEVNPRPSP